MVGHLLQAKNEKKHSIEFFLHLSKAFNTLDHTVLLKKLESFGVSVNWF